LDMSDDDLKKTDFQVILKPALLKAFEGDDITELGNKLDSLDGKTYLLLCSQKEGDAMNKLMKYGLSFSLANKIYANLIVPRNTNQSKVSTTFLSHFSGSKQVTIPNLIEFGKSFENKAFKDGGTRDEWFKKVDDLARLDVPLFGRKSDVKQIFGFIEMLLKEGKSDRGTQTSLVLTGGPGVGSHHLNFLIEIINTQTTTKKKFSSSLPYRQDSFLCGTEEGAYFVFERHQPARFSQTL